MPSVTVTKGVSGLGDTMTNSVVITDDGGMALDVTIPGSTADVEVEIQFDTSRLKYIYIEASGTLTLETNSSSAADDTFTLTADHPFEWDSQSGIPNPFTADVTKFFLSRGSAGSVDVNIVMVKDPTP